MGSFFNASFLLLVMLAPSPGLLSAPQKRPQTGSSLEETITRLDQRLFEAFNHCDKEDQLRAFGAFFAPNVEFYHDEGGVTWTRAEMIGRTRAYVAGKYRRELIPGSLKVYPIKGYGALETGLHQFVDMASGKPTGLADFSHVWRRRNKSWEITRVLSYGHRPFLEPNATASEQDPFEDDAATERWLQTRHIPILGLGVLRGGVLKSVKIYGHLAAGPQAPLDTLFNVASLTKPLTALVALRLVDEGKLDLDEPLAKHWVDPDLKDDPRLNQLTTRLVLSHRTGFPNWRWMDASKKLSFAFDPGSRYQYSGEGFEYLRRALEAKTGSSLEALAQRMVFEPLGMRHTRFTWDAATPEALFAHGFDPQGKAYPLAKWTQANAADLLLTTVSDYGAFLSAVMQGRLLSAGLQQEMLKPHVETKPGKTFGLGWERYELPEGRYVLSHGGADPGVQTQVFLLPQTGDGLILFTNVDDGAKVYGPLLKHFLGKAGEAVLSIETGH